VLESSSTLGSQGHLEFLLFALDEFPIEIWERLRTQVLAKKGAHLLQYASSRGDPELRKAIATYLCDYRGARGHSDQIVITAGTQQAMMISAMALVNPGEVAWIEDPGFYQAPPGFWVRRGHRDSETRGSGRNHDRPAV
jgi:DNA-binding transcriptional MocR family regulator